jgi:hypothetical protein
MAILNNSNAISTTGGYDINNSLRFRASASATLSRTPSTTSNRQTWTWSAWVKRGTLSTLNPLFNGQGVGTGSAQTLITFTSTDILRVYTDNATSSDLQTTQVFRDPSAWYHIVVAFDTTQATAANRVKIYVNGNQVTAFGTASYPAQNLNTAINLTNQHNIGKPYDAFYFDGYMADINLIDGSQKAASDFGETDTTTGSWKPKAYSGTYGTNGFYLKFSDIATTSGSNAGLGKDFSGNSNYWTTNNISVTAGRTYDAMTDSPTLTSETVANYAVLNPLNVTANTPSSGNLQSVLGSTENGITSTIAIPSNVKSYWEITPTSSSTASIGTYAGVTTLTTRMNQAASYSVAGVYAFLAVNNLRLWANGTAGSTAVGTLANTSILQVAIDNTTSGSNTYVWIGKDNVWYNSTLGTTGDPATAANPTFTIAKQDFYAYFSGYLNTINVNFGQRPFSYTPPTGFVALNTYNLPDSTIKKGSTVMDAVIYTGNGISGRAVNTTTGFRPDFAWAKSRSVVGGSNILMDSNRGNGNYLISESTAAEGTGVADLTFTSTGVTWNNGVSLNNNGSTYVNWFWQAGQGTNTTNTSGTITSTVSVNATAGFSIVTYTGTGANATVGHGLGVAPKMIIVKGRSAVSNWLTYHESIGNTKYLLLNTTDASATASTAWNNTSPTSNVFSLGTAANGSGTTFVAYCWAEIAGFSRFGSYTGNGSTDGPFQYLGFRPKFILYKNASYAGTSWAMLDSSRNTYNVLNARLFAESSSAEDTSVSPMDFTSNGFKVRSTNDGVNRNGDTIIYMAFAENPFRNSLAR